MKPIKSILTGIMAGWLTIAPPAFAQEPKEPVKQEVVQLSEEKTEFPIKLGFRIDYLSKYISRGFTYSEKSVIQPTLCATYDNFSLIGFGNFDTHNKKFNETDLTLDFTKTFKDLTFSAGYILLTFPNTEQRKTQEIYAGVTLEKILKPGLKLFQDFDEGKGTYGEFSIEHYFDLRRLGISTKALLGYNNHYFRKSKGLSHTELRLATPISLGKNITFIPILNYSKSLDKKDFKDQLVGGITLNFNY